MFDGLPLRGRPILPSAGFLRITDQRSMAGPAPTTRSFYRGRFAARSIAMVDYASLSRLRM